jgi:hypothetical protein
VVVASVEVELEPEPVVVMVVMVVAAVMPERESSVADLGQLLSRQRPQPLPG